MGSRLLISLILTTILSGWAAADNNYFVVADYSPQTLSSFNGSYWGRQADKMLLTGNDADIALLSRSGVIFESSPFDMDISVLYLVYGNARGFRSDDVGPIFVGDQFHVSRSRPHGNMHYRRIRHLPLPRKTSDPVVSLLLTYDPLIDQMIGRVDTDTIMDYLARLSGALPIEIDGQPDTIHTRYSGTDDNNLASEYIRQVLEDYGYQAEFHGFYGGTIRHFCAHDENLAWTVTESSEALRTTDGGASWTVMPDEATSSLWGIANIGADLIWLTGDRGTIRFSDDGGESFTAQSSGSNSFLFGIDFINESDGWIAGDGGMVFHTVNGGQNWSIQSTPTGSRLYDICFVDQQYGWACGRDGRIINTTDGGDTWTMQTSNTSQRLYGIDFVDSEDGWCVGWGGVVRHTTDGGTTWDTVDLGSNVEKYHVEFADSQFGCIVGWLGEIFVTTDGGATWEQKNSGVNNDLYGIAFVDSLVGYAGGNGSVLKTIDGGDTWVSQTQNIDSAWRNVIATKQGSVDPDQQVVICAHMDNRSQTPETYAPGSDDNGSGSIAVIEAARIFSQYEFERTIKFCLWTGEEQGLMGSAAYAADAAARSDDIIGVFNFDMIAWDGNGDGSVEFHAGTDNSSIALGNLMSEVVTDYNLALNPDIITYGATGASDHASFWDAGYAAVLGIEDYSSDFNPYYHTTGDNMDHIITDFFTEFTKVSIGASAALAIPDSTNTSVDKGSSLPGGYALAANYPNPFNAVTTISFTVPARSYIELAVYDILGRRTATLYSGSVDAGEHRVTWNAGERASAVYFYRLIAGNIEATGRMTLLK